MVLVDENKGLLDFLFIKVNPMDMMDRILIISSLLEKFLSRQKIKKLNYEYVFLNRLNPKTFGEASRLLQQVLYVCHSLDIDCVPFNPTEIKKFACFSKAEKRDMLAALKTKQKKIYESIAWQNLNEKETEGIADAIWISLM